MAVAQSMVRGNLAEQEGVFDEGAEEVDRVNLRTSLRILLDDGAVIGSVQTHNNIVVGKRKFLSDSVHNFGEDCCSYFGSTASAPHRCMGERSQSFWTSGNGNLRGRVLFHLHERQARTVSCHPGPIDPVFELPQPCSLDTQSASGSHTLGWFSSANDPEKVLLRNPLLKRLSKNSVPNIPSQRRATTDSKHSCLGTGMIYHGRDVANRENIFGVH
mmetsp:Transcript_44346/g.139917  ORF Transcript_44346/g.139917 Transcript_44346/m.139917 type:complete len:216 (+) Transcript_44346:858-1505(+)